MGLVMLGSGSQTALDEMMQYAHETQHEKIIRGLAIGIAFLMYGRAEQADTVIDQLLADKVRSANESIRLSMLTSVANRTPSSDMVVCTPSASHMPEQATIRLSESYCKSLSLTPMTMYDERL